MAYDKTGGVVLTDLVSDQCVRWDCYTIPFRPNEYCSQPCASAASFGPSYTAPVGMSIFFSSSAEFAPVATKILNLLHINKEPGVPRLSSELFKIPPWQSSMFGIRPSPRESFYEWMFISSIQIPEASEFKWEGGRSRIIGEVSLRVFKPSPSEDSLWKLTQYTLPDSTEIAVYVMHRDSEYL